MKSWVKRIKLSAQETEVTALQRAAQYLEEKMRLIRESGVLSLDRVAIITALNVAHQLLALEQQKNQHAHMINQRLIELQTKVENALGPLASLCRAGMPDFLCPPSLTGCQLRCGARKSRHFTSA